MRQKLTRDHSGVGVRNDFYLSPIDTSLIPYNSTSYKSFMILNLKPLNLEIFR